MSNYRINIENSVIDHNSSVVRNDYRGTSDTDDAILEELQKIQKELEQTEPLISQTLSDLQDAIRKKNSSKISSIAQRLSTGFAASLLANLASGSLLSFLGIH